MIREMEYKKLDWDSSFFGILTGMITCNDRQEEVLAETLHSMKEQGFRLVYFPAAFRIENERILDQYNGILADEKVTFVKVFGENVLPEPDSHIISYEGPEVSIDLLTLAWESGIYSRFKVDPHFKNDEYKHLYKKWIERSVSREIAKDVLVYMDGSVIGGMITLGEKNNRGDIGLVAVAESSRGKGIGKKLMAGAENVFKKMGYTQVQVVTQGINTPAMKLYENSGYTIDERLFYYHFWL
jgi:dTDP-4-amino-4,6-dideoxy-D-galactose acyltransferase